MRESIGSVFLYNIIIVFIVITFGFLSASLSYMKAFKVNGKIANALEKYEGYNWLSDKEIAKTLTAIGYRTGEIECPESLHKDDRGEGYTALPSAGYKKHQYCIYEYIKGTDFKGGYFNYGILTYIYLDIPILGGTFKVKVYSESESIFKFSV